MSLKEVFNKYNAECDLAVSKYNETVYVTWAEYELAVQVERLQGQNEDLKTRCEMLEKRLNALVPRLAKLETE